MAPAYGFGAGFGRRDDGGVRVAPPYVEPVGDDPIDPPSGDPVPPTDTPIDPETDLPEPGVDPDYVEPTRIEITNSKQTIIRTSEDPNTWANAYVAADLVGPEYWEVEIANSTPRGATLAVGVSNLLMALNGIPGALSGTVAYWSNGAVYKGGAIVASLPSYGRGDRIGIAFAANGEVRFYKNCVALNGGAAVATLAGPAQRFPFVGLYSSASRATFRFALSRFGCSIPAGYFPIGQVVPTEFLLLSSIDELVGAEYLLLSGDQQSGTDKLGLSGDH